MAKKMRRSEGRLTAVTSQHIYATVYMWCSLWLDNKSVKVVQTSFSEDQEY